MTVCYIRNVDDYDDSIRKRAVDLGVDLVEIRQRHGFDRRIWPELQQLARSRQVDLVHAHDYKTDLLALLLRRKAAIVPLSTAHGWTGHSWRERLVYYPVDKRLLRQFPGVIAVSSEIQRELIGAGVSPCRIRTVLNGIDHRLYRPDPSRSPLERHRLGLKSHDFAIRAVGRLEPQKRFDLLIQAYARIRSTNPNLKLLIAGEGSRRKQLEDEIQRLGVADGCRLLGHCADVVGFYHAIDLMAQSSDYEGTPNVVLEAMAFEIPIVATDVGGTCELIRHEVEALVVPPGDADALAKAIERVLALPAAAAQRVTAARERIETELSFETRQNTVENLYEQLLRERRGGLPISQDVAVRKNGRG